MIETLPQWAQIGFWVVMLVFTHTFTFAWGYSLAKKFWRGLLYESREKRKSERDFAMSRIAALSDGVGGKCPTCKGWGVVGEDGSSDCMRCCGTGIRDLSEIRDQNEVILKKAINDCDTTKERLTKLLNPTLPN